MTIQIGIIIILVTILALELIARYFYKKEIIILKKANSSLELCYALEKESYAKLSSVLGNCRDEFARLEKSTKATIAALTEQHHKDAMSLLEKDGKIAERHDLVCRQSKEIKELKIVLDNTRKALRERTSRCDDLKKEFTDRVNEYNMTRQKEARIVASGINEIANLGIAGNFRGIEGEEIITKMFPRLVLEIRNRVEGNRANYDAFGNIVVPPPAPPSAAREKGSISMFEVRLESLKKENNQLSEELLKYKYPKCFALKPGADLFLFGNKYFFRGIQDNLVCTYFNTQKGTLQGIRFQLEEIEPQLS